MCCGSMVWQTSVEFFVKIMHWSKYCQGEFLLRINCVVESVGRNIHTMLPQFIELYLHFLTYSVEKMDLHI
jgi:hypothetical protein